MRWQLQQRWCRGRACRRQRRREQRQAGTSFLLNFVKSILTPTQLPKWLGVLINSVTMRLHAMPEKVVAMEAVCGDPR